VAALAPVPAIGSADYYIIERLQTLEGRQPIRLGHWR
jgi:hypothetical protein